MFHRWNPSEEKQIYFYSNNTHHSSTTPSKVVTIVPANANFTWISFANKINWTHFNRMAFQCIANGMKCNGDIIWLQPISNWIDKSISDEWVNRLFVCLLASSLFCFVLFCSNSSLSLSCTVLYVCSVHGIALSHNCSVSSYQSHNSPNFALKHCLHALFAFTCAHGDSSFRPQSVQFRDALGCWVCVIF